MPTTLSVNVNKIALLRNSRGTDYPNLIQYISDSIDNGIQAITAHPRQDERHIKYQDVYDISNFLINHPNVELNVEGYPSDKFLSLVEKTRPTQCTLVPDSRNQLTSDHGWSSNEKECMELRPILKVLKNNGVRTAILMDPVLDKMALAKN